MHPHGTPLRRFAGVLTLSLGIGALFPAVAGELPLRSSHSGAEEVWRRLIPVTLQPVARAKPGTCGPSLSAEDLHVKIDGREVLRVEDLERMTPTTIHALLIDNSGSMRGARLETAKQLAKRYVDGLRDFEKATLYTFDEDSFKPYIHGARSLGTEIDEIADGSRTYLWSGIDLVGQELSNRPESQRVLAIFSDAGTQERILDQQQAIRIFRNANITVFLFGIEMSADPQLLRFVEGTGGSVFKLSATTSRRDVRDRTKALDRVSTWVTRHAVVTVLEDDNEDDTTKTGREEHVRVETDPFSDHSMCRVRVRTVWSHPAEPSAIDRDTVLTESTLSSSPKWLQLAPNQAPRTPEGPIRLVEQGGLPSTCPAELENLVYLEPASAGGGTITGCFLDIERQVGHLLSELEQGAQKPIDKRWPDPPEFKLRPFRIELPELGSVPTRVSAILDELSRHAGNEQDSQPFLNHTLDPALVDGSIDSWQWELMSRSLIRFPEIAEFVRRRVYQRVEQKILARFEEFRQRMKIHELDPAVRRELERSPEIAGLRRRQNQLTLEDAMTYAAGRLGDVRADELFREWEIDWLDRYLGNAAPPEFLNETAASGADFVMDVERVWRHARRFFFPKWTRILTPLVLLHDPDQARYGFVRVILPRPAWAMTRLALVPRAGWNDDVPYDLIPRRPLALGALHRVIGERVYLSQLGAAHPLQVSTLSYEPAASTEVPPLALAQPDHPYSRATIRLVLESEDGWSVKMEATVRDPDHGPFELEHAWVHCAGPAAACEGLNRRYPE